MVLTFCPGAVCGWNKGSSMNPVMNNEHARPDVGRERGHTLSSSTKSSCGDARSTDECHLISKALLQGSCTLEYQVASLVSNALFRCGV